MSRQQYHPGIFSVSVSKSEVSSIPTALPSSSRSLSILQCTFALTPELASAFSSSHFSNQQGKTFVVKSVEGHWRLHNERDILNRFQARAPTLRPLLDKTEDPVEPTAIVLKYLDDDLKVASNAKSLTRQEIKYVARNVLEALQVLHQDGYVHTGIYWSPPK